MSQHSEIFCWISSHWSKRVLVSIYRLTPPVFVDPTVGLPPRDGQRPHPDEAPELRYGVPGAPHHPAVSLTARLQSLRVEAEYLQVPAGSPQSQLMTLSLLPSLPSLASLVTAIITVIKSITVAIL